MNSFYKSKQLYIADHLSKDLAQPKRRLNALKAIEQVMKDKDPKLMDGGGLFEKFDKSGFNSQYEIWKGSSLSDAEKSVITGLFKFSR